MAEDEVGRERQERETAWSGTLALQPSGPSPHPAAYLLTPRQIERFPLSPKGAGRGASEHLERLHPQVCPAAKTTVP